MSQVEKVLEILLIEDDPENLELLLESLPKSVAGHQLNWDPCRDFREAVRRVVLRRYDLIVTDIYRDRTDRKKGLDAEDESARDIIGSIRRTRFCPVVAFTDGSKPQSFELGPFIRFADKTQGNRDIVARIEELVATGIPDIARRLHDELDGAAGSYLWEFLEKNWEQMCKAGGNKSAVLERIVRRRASIQIGRLDPTQDASEVEAVEGAEYYICPPISGKDLRLGEILRRRGSAEFRVVLQPHCHLAVQHKATAPRAEFVLTVCTVQAKVLYERHRVEGATEEAKLKSLARRLQSPAKVGQPDGRYWFLPSLLDMPDLYCDFLQLGSVEFAAIEGDYERFAVLDTPFAEALQSCFTSFYSAVGLPELIPESFRHLL